MWMVEHRSVRSIFLSAASRYPGHPALRVGSEEFTYSNLEETARTWGSAINRALGRRALRIGVLSRRTYAGYCGILASLCAGASFVPLNPRFPKDRTRAMIEAADLCAIIVDPADAYYLRDVLPSLKRVPLLLAPGCEPTFSDSQTIDPAIGCVADELPSLLDDDLAYILFTSGTTGQPKGVAISQGNVVQFIDVITARHELGPGDRCSNTFESTFDVCVYDMFATWASGALLVTMRDVDLLAPVKYVNDNQITVWFSVPSIPMMALKTNRLTPASMPSLRLSCFAGEALATRVAEAWSLAAPNSIVDNLYGPTESTVVCFGHVWDRNRPAELQVNGQVPIGKPLPGNGAVLVDANGNYDPELTEGELCVCGPQTSPGYWRNPALTAERFPTFDLSPDRRTRFYRTGDAVKLLSDGEFAFIGRVDHQVQVNGFRVELAAIEAEMMKFSQVAGAAVVPYPIEFGSVKGLVAFVLGSNIDVESILERLRETLPSYMVPRTVHVVNEFPFNANGKVDRNALAREAERLNHAVLVQQPAQRRAFAS